MGLTKKKPLLSMYVFGHCLLENTPSVVSQGTSFLEDDVVLDSPVLFQSILLNYTAIKTGNPYNVKL